MTQPDFSDPQHRLDNLMNMRFVKAFSVLHHCIQSPKWADNPVSDLREVLVHLEVKLAAELGLPTTTLVGRLIDMGNELANDKDAQTRGESPVG